MDARLQSKLKAMIASLAEEYQAELAEQGTMATLEELTCEIGDMVTRELTSREAQRRASLLDANEAECPDCGRASPRAAPDAVILNGLRGEVEYTQPCFYCRKCRRTFSPSGGLAGALASRDRDARDVPEDGACGQ